MDKERVMEIHSNHNVFSSQQILTNVRLPMVVVVTNVEILGVRSPVRVRLDISQTIPRSNVKKVSGCSVLNTATHVKISQLVNKMWFAKDLQQACEQIVTLLLLGTLRSTTATSTATVVKRRCKLQYLKEPRLIDCRIFYT